MNVYKVNSLTLSTGSNAVDGRVRWDPCRSLLKLGLGSAPTPKPARSSRRSCTR